MEEMRIHENMIKITQYDLKGKLPDPFLFEDGSRVTSKADWARRRAELYRHAVELQYGTVPPSPEVLEIEVLYNSGKEASYRITTGRKKRTVSFEMWVFKASATEKCPAVVDGDLCFPYEFDREFIHAFVDNGIHFVTFNRTALFPDISAFSVQKTVAGSAERDCMEQVLQGLERGERCGELAKIYPEYSFGAVGAWAWGYSRCVDALERLGFADMECITFTGHSRGGKTAILAGVLDDRAAIVNPNETCAGGCSCYRLAISAITEQGKEARSEVLGDMVKNFPSWLGDGMKAYAGREEELPFDSHELKALVAPRVLFVSEAASDIWANPVGSWQTTMGAAEVYKLLDVEENLYWYFRSGYHHHHKEDIQRLVELIRHVRYGEELRKEYFKTPFVRPALAFDWRAPAKKE